MRKSRFLTRVFVSAFIAAICVTAAQAAAQPEGPCTPPGAWTTRADFPSTIVRAWGQYFPPDGKFYLLGGRFDDNPGSDFIQVNIYDPLLDTWSQSNSTFVDGQVNNMVGGVLDFGGTQYIVVVGGSAAGATTSTADVRQYDPVGDSIVVLTGDPWPGVGPSNTILPGGAAVYENKLFVFGGFEINVGMVTTIWQFDPAAAEGSRWTQMTATLPTPIGYVPAATSGSLIYLFGGSGWDGTTLFDTTESSSYDPVADTIAPVSAIPRATAETRAVTMSDGTVWVLGGGRVDPNPSNEVDIYDPVGDSWTLGPAFTNPRRNFPAGIDPVTGTVWAVGGYDIGNLPLFFNEEFTACVVVDDTIFEDGFDGPPPP
jgi:N-acetylneuraminic acid mutarotase